MKRGTSIAASALLLTAVVGCSSGPTVGAFEQQTVRASYQNASAVNAIVQTDPDVPQYVKDWFELEVEQWSALDSWVHGQPVTTGGN